MKAPEIRVLIQSAGVAQRRKPGWQDQRNFSLKRSRNLVDPLRHNARGRDDKSPAHEAANLEFPEDQSGLDCLAKTDFVGEQVANAVAGHGTGERLKLMGQRDDASLQRCHKRVAT